MEDASHVRSNSQMKTAGGKTEAESVRTYGNTVIRSREMRYIAQIKVRDGGVGQERRRLEKRGEGKT